MNILNERFALSLGRLMSMKAEGLSGEEIVEQTGLTPLAMHKAFSAIAGRSPGQFEALFGAPEHDVRILVDECCPPHMISPLYPKFGRMTHVGHLGFLSMLDPELYDRAAGIRQGLACAPFDAVFTYDDRLDTMNDLKRYAISRAFERDGDLEAQRALPMLVIIKPPHLGAETTVPERFEALVQMMLRQQAGIMEKIESKDGPVLYVSTAPDSPRLETTYENLSEYHRLHIEKDVHEADFTRIHPVTAAVARYAKNLSEEARWRVAEAAMINYGLRFE